MTGVVALWRHVPTTLKNQLEKVKDADFVVYKKWKKKSIRAEGQNVFSSQKIVSSPYFFHLLKDFRLFFTREKGAIAQDCF